MGSINFASPKSTPTAWSNPVQPGTQVDLEVGANKAKHGMTSGGTIVMIPGSSRKQHFSIANRIMGNGMGQYSPPALTWHHQYTRYLMVQVDRTVHAKHGHNGRNLYW